MPDAEQQLAPTPPCGRDLGEYGTCALSPEHTGWCTPTMLDAQGNWTDEMNAARSEHGVPVIPTHNGEPPQCNAWCDGVECGRYPNHPGPHDRAADCGPRCIDRDDGHITIHAAGCTKFGAGIDPEERLPVTDHSLTTTTYDAEQKLPVNPYPEGTEAARAWARGRDAERDITDRVITKRMVEWTKVDMRVAQILYDALAESHSQVYRRSVARPKDYK